MTSVWSELNHDTRFAAVEEAIGKKLSSLLRKRNSYINRVYELEVQGTKERLVAKFYRPGRWTPKMIQEEHTFLKELEKNEIPVIPPLSFGGKTIFGLGHIAFALFPKKGGRALDEFDKQGWETLGRIIARMHLVGASHKASGRISWKPSSATRHHLEVLLSGGWVLDDFRSTLKEASEEFIKKAEPHFSGHESILLHGDMHKGNLIHRAGEGTFIIDFDDISFGPPVQDIWMLLPGEPEDCENELAWFLKGYETFREFDRGSLNLVSALRGMRLIHFASWLSVQSRDPDFSRHFPEAGNRRYWNQLIKDIHEIVYERIF